MICEHIISEREDGYPLDLQELPEILDVFRECEREVLDRLVDEYEAPRLALHKLNYEVDKKVFLANWDGQYVPNSIVPAPVKFVPEFEQMRLIRAIPTNRVNAPSAPTPQRLNPQQEGPVLAGPVPTGSTSTQDAPAVQLDPLIPDQPYPFTILETRLTASWPQKHAATPAEQAVCSVAGILRWIKIVTTRFQEANIPPTLPHDRAGSLIWLAQADFSTDADPAVKEQVAKAIERCVDLGLDILEILEGTPMVDKLWSQPHCLLFNEAVVEQVDGWGDIYDYPVADNVEASRIFIRDPFTLATTIQAKLGLKYSEERKRQQIFLATPPEIIRVHWQNSSTAAPSGDQSTFNALQAFELSYKKARVREGIIRLVDGSTSYRLICIVRLPKRGDIIVLAEHFYKCDGYNFVPKSCDDRSQAWSCQEPGEYFMVYARSDQARFRHISGHKSYVSTERTVPSDDRVLAEWMRRFASDEPGSVQPIAPDLSFGTIDPPGVPTSAGPVVPPSVTPARFSFHVTPPAEEMPVPTFGFGGPKIEPPEISLSALPSAPSRNSAFGSTQVQDRATEKPQARRRKRGRGGKHRKRPARHNNNPFENRRWATSNPRFSTQGPANSGY